MTRRILFPFSVEREIDQGYSWSMDLAVKLNAQLCCYTAISDLGELKQLRNQKIQEALQHARKVYLRRSRLALKDRKKISTHKCIEEGDFANNLINYVCHHKFDVVVVDPMATALTRETLDDVVSHAEGVIVLPSARMSETHNLRNAQTEDDFYDVLRKSECYRLRGAFFKMLGQDKGVFNYLRGIFSKKERSAT